MAIVVLRTVVGKHILMNLYQIDSWYNIKVVEDIVTGHTVKQLAELQT